MKSRPDINQDAPQDTPENRHAMQTRKKNGIVTTSKRLYSVFIQSQLEMETKKTETLTRAKKARTGDLNIDEKLIHRVKKTTVKKKKETTITTYRTEEMDAPTRHPLSGSTTKLHLDYEVKNDNGSSSLSFRIDSPFLDAPYLETHQLTPLSMLPPMTPSTPLPYTPGTPLSIIGNHLEYRNEIRTPDAVIFMNTIIDVKSPKAEEVALNIFGEPFESSFENVEQTPLYASGSFGYFATPPSIFVPSNEEVDEWTHGL